MAITEIRYPARRAGRPAGQPGLEEVWLVCDGDMWHLSRDQGFAAAGWIPGSGDSIGVPTRR
jgi:hypothetical protein